MSDVISPKRIVLLLRREFPNTRNATLILLFTLFVFLALRGYRFHPYPENQELIVGMFRTFLFLGGCTFASLGFVKMHDKQQNFSWFMLPASILEKFTAQLLLSTIIYIVFLLVGFVFVTLAVDTLVQFLFTHNLGLFRPMDTELWILIGKYFLFHSVFFLGAAYFKKQAFLKTIAVIALFMAVLSTLLVLFVYWNYPAAVEGADITIDLTPKFLYFLKYQPYVQWFVYAFLPLLFWYIAYIRVSKTEISHGV